MGDRTIVLLFEEVVHPQDPVRIELIVAFRKILEEVGHLVEEEVLAVVGVAMEVMMGLQVMEPMIKVLRRVTCLLITTTTIVRKIPFIKMGTVEVHHPINMVVQQIASIKVLAILKVRLKLRLKLRTKQRTGEMGAISY